MLLDKILMKKLSDVGAKILENAKLENTPKSLKEMYLFLKSIKESIEEGDFAGIIMGNIFFYFVSSLEVRDRQVTSRIFEDIFSSLFSTKPTDLESRINPEPGLEILELDSLCENSDWKISQDLQSNKREKTDLILGDYEISLKTLKGQAYNDDGIIIDKDLNSELNVGSFSYRALLKGILSDDQLNTLSDRKGGMGSGSQLRRNVFEPIKKANKSEEFLKRLKLFFEYVYTEDVIIVLKSNYKIEFFLINSESFNEVIFKLYEQKEENFTDIWYRWENNNLRLNWRNMIKYLDEFDLNYYNISLDLSSSIDDKKIKDFIEDVSNFIEEKFEELLN